MASRPAFQPQAEPFHAEGHWRAGDLWEDVAARAHEHPERVAMVLGEREMRYDELIRAAVGVSQRLAEAGVQPGDGVVLLGRHPIEAGGGPLRCPPPGRGRPPPPPEV